MNNSERVLKVLVVLLSNIECARQAADRRGALALG
jgi:hypothetical protein